MQWILQNWWMLFTAALVLFLLTTLWMANLARHFYLEPGRVKFSIFEMELPASETAFYQLFKMMGAKAGSYVRRHLVIDFLFMAAAYPGIALLCIKTSGKMEYLGKWIFLGLAVLQIIPWLFDIVENSYLLRKLKQPIDTWTIPGEEQSKSYRNFQVMVKIKFVIAFTGAVCSLFGLLYFWITGNYSRDSLPWLGGVLVLILIAGFISKAVKPKVVAE